jgi:geranylgeranyl reductase family protein
VSEPLWDVAVVGAGPAGSAAALGALAARPDARVLLLDREDLPRDKACGDGVAPHVIELLTALGADADALVRGYAPVGTLDLGRPAGPQVVGEMARHAHVVPREVLDHRIAQAALARGAVLRRHRVREIDVRPGEVRLDGAVRARVVVGADGASSVVRRHLVGAATRPGRTALAIRGYAPVRAEHAAAQVIRFAPTRWPAYAWSFPLGDGRANVGYGEVLRDDAPLTREVLLARLEELLPGAGDGVTTWRAHHLPLSTGRTRQPDGRVLLAGDAASLVNPMTGEGIYYAVRSGALAGWVAVTERDPGRALRRHLRRALGAHLRTTDAVAALTRWQPVVDAGLEAARRERRVFDALVEIGLADGLLPPRAVWDVARRVGARSSVGSAGKARRQEENRG